MVEWLLSSVLQLFSTFCRYYQQGSRCFYVHIELDVHYDADLLGVTSLADKSRLWANWDALPKSALRSKFTRYLAVGINASYINY